jgi:cytochrome c oxidase subunit 4
MKKDKQETHRIPDRTYVFVWIALVLLTGVTVSVAGMSLGRFGILAALMIAAFKSGLVLNYFMHLKVERGLRLFKLMVPGIILILVLFIGLTFFDVAFR